MAGTVLYIDDDPELPRGTAEELSRLGFRLKHIGDPEEALRWARNGLARMVLLEVLQPDCDGWQLLGELGACPGTAGALPVLVLTRGERTPELYSRAVEAGAEDFLSKPVLRAELLAAILDCAERSESVRELDAGGAAPGQGGTAAFSGDLGQTPLAELLLRFRRVGANGVLVLQFEGETRGIQLRNGSPAASASNRGFETLEDFLVRTKEISGDEHAVVVGAASEGGRSSGDVMLELGMIDERGLQDALDRRAAEPLLEGFEWLAGSFRFEAGKQLKSKQAMELSQNPGRVLLEGVLRWLPASRVRQLLDGRAAHYVSKEDRPLYSLSELGSLACTPEALEALAGDRTVAEVLEAGLVEERMLYGLLVAGLVEVHPDPILDLSMELEPEVEESDTTLEMEPPAAPAQTSEPTPEPLAADEPPSAPDPPKGGAADEDGSRRLEAERWFNKGGEQLAARRYEQAIEAFGMAAHLDPSQGEYHAHLGFALHRKHPEEEMVRREALEHIAKGVKLSPDAWRPLVYLGRVFRESGDLVSARKVIGRAVRKHPDCAAARSEMRLLKAAEEPEANGVMDRVRGWLKRGR